ncbi:metal-dependent transcriptional regulator [Methanococcoides methylutens]|uniref:metal-dependent transcriptional regulator n=1 Tax=Methanococcoides methylutens TaxID=2226 RepID=UPI004044F320
MTADRIEEYLETILSLSNNGELSVKNKDIADELGISQAAVSEMVQKLNDEGVVDHQPYHGIRLTSTGLSEAKKLRRKHHVIEKFLSDVLEIDPEVSHNEACGLEHAVSDIVVESMCRFMGSNNIDCNPVDDDECCLFKENYVALSDLKEGDSGTVVMMTLPDSSKERLTCLGLIVGESVDVKRKQKQGSTSILTRGTEIALGNEIARKIFVRLGARKRYPRGSGRN